MANVVRAPFFVPRPAEDQLWSWMPDASGIIPLSTQQKMFGANGQVPAKRWNGIYTFDDPAVWKAAPLSNQLLTTVNNKNVLNLNVAKHWNTIYSFDDPAVWNWPPQPSDIIPLSTFQKFYGIGGQVPAKRWNIAYTFDDPSVWWDWTNRNNAGLLAAQANPFVPVAWRFHADDPPPWAQPRQRSIALPFVPAIQNRWRLDPSDDQLWSLTIQRDLPLNTITVSPFTSRQSRFDYDDAAVWHPGPIFSKTLPMLTVGGQVKSRQWLFGYDDPAYWVGRPLNVASPIPMLTIGGIIKAKQWHWDNDDPSMWSGWANRNLVSIVVQLNPFVPVFYRFHNDDPAIWQQPPQRSVALPLVPPIVNRWRLDPSDDQPWSMTPPRVSPLMAVTVSPFTGRPYRFAIGDDVVWQRLILRSIALPTVPAINNRQKQDVPDDQLWTALLHRNDLLTLIATAPPSPFTSRQPSFAYDDFSSWTWLPRNNRFLPYTFVASPRVADTPQELRSVDTVPKIRSADAPIEVRSADAPPKT